MKRNTLAILGCYLVLGAALTVPALAQRVPLNYTVITYYKVPPDKVASFLETQRTQYQKYYESLIASGDIKSWSLLKLTMPYAVSSDFNYSNAVNYAKFPELDRSEQEIEARYKKSGGSMEEVAKNIRPFRVNQVITRTRLRIGSQQAGDYIRVDYHSVPAEHAVEISELEEAIYAPGYKAVIDQNSGMKGWSLASPVAPIANEIGWNFYTVQAFKDSDSLGRGPFLSQEIFTKLFPNKDYTSTMMRVRSVDKIVKIRYFHVLAAAGSPVGAK